MSTGDHRDIILDSIADGVFTIDLNDTITSFNRAAERITGVPRDQAVGQKCFDVLRASICQTDCFLHRSMRTGMEHVNRRVNILNSEGRTIPVSISTAVLRDRAGNVIGGVETFRDLSEIEILRREIENYYTFEDIVSKNDDIRRIFDILPDIAATDSTVLIEGPSGSGKELFARAIHNLGARHKKRLVVVNCGALPDTLLESELFGYVAGAFTDAKKDKPGRFALAEGGTIFLDEIGDVSPALQAKLLRVLQEKEYEPLGSAEPRKANVRVIAATNKSLSDLMADGSFRSDLYYRLNVVKIVLPPLSQRREDVPLLIDHFIRKFNAAMAKEIDSVSPEVLDLLMRYDFPGNVRELENIIEHAFVLCRDSTVRLEHLPGELTSGLPEHHPPATDTAETPLEKAEITAIVEILAKHGGNRRRTAAELGIDKTTLWRKMKRYGITFPPVKPGA
jgi:PAS domain S-box-containing protein